MASSSPQFFKNSDAKNEVNADSLKFSTNPDAQNKFKTDPNDWKAFSEETLTQFKEKKFEADEKETEFYKAYDFLREKREEAARKFGHTKPNGTYGNWRPSRPVGVSGFHAAYEIIFVEDKPQTWSANREKVVEHVKKLVNEVHKSIDLKNKDKENTDLKNEDQDPELANFLKFVNSGEYIDADEYIYKRDQGEELVGDEEFLATIHSFEIKAPKVEGIQGHSSTVTVELLEFLEKKNDYVRILYPANPPFDNDWKIGNIYWKQLNDWKKEDDIPTFLKIAGRLCHLMAPLLPLEGGSASVMEWMIRGIAEKKGIDLGNFNYNEKIGWDFKAFLTPDREEFANWFSKKAYVAPKLIPTLDANQASSLDSRRSSVGRK